MTTQPIRLTYKSRSTQPGDGAYTVTSEESENYRAELNSLARQSAELHGRVLRSDAAYSVGALPNERIMEIARDLVNHQRRLNEIEGEIKRRYPSGQFEKQLRSIGGFDNGLDCSWLDDRQIGTGFAHKIRAAFKMLGGSWYRPGQPAALRNLPGYR